MLSMLYGLVRQLLDNSMRFQGFYVQVATLFEWKFTRNDLGQLFAKIDTP